MKSQLHNQSSEDVIAELQKSNDTIAVELHELIVKGQLRTLNATSLRELKSVYGSSTWDTPILSGQESLPWPALPSLDDLKKTLQSDLKKQQYTFSPPRATESEDARAAAKLVRQLHDPDYSSPGSVYHLVARSLNSSATFQKWYEDGMLGATPMYVTLMPANDSCDLEYHETWTLSTLLSGLKLWIVYAPSAGNLGLLRSKYESDAENEFDDKESWETMSRMTGGIAIVQRPGQMLYMPPFCPHAVFNIHTSVSAAYRITTANRAIQRFQNIPLYVQRNRYEDPAVHPRKLLEYANSLSVSLYHILNNTIDRFASTREITKVCKVWDLVKGDVRALCAAVGDDEEAKEVYEKFKVVWINHLEQKRKKSAKCRLCGLRIKDMSGTLAEHFEASHWAPMQEGKDQKRSREENTEDMVEPNEEKPRTYKQNARLNI